MKLGLIGLGGMGTAMARSLLKAGHHVTVFNRTASRAEALRSEGAVVARSVEEACADGMVITMLADDQAVADVVWKTGFLKSLPSGGIHLSMSTISVALARKLAEAHAEARSALVSAPVFGRPAAAEAARLLVVAAGPAEAIARSKEVFSAIGNRVEVVGTDPAAANIFKLTGNFMIAASQEMLAESFALLRKSGVDHRQFLQIMTETLFAAPIFKIYGALIADEQFEPAGFTVPLGLKDIRLVLAAAEAVSTPMPVANVVRDHLITTIARGRERQDWSSLAQVVAENAGL